MQLEAGRGVKGAGGVAKFQFHIGAIRSALLMFHLLISFLFQFHIGAIRR